MSPSYPSDLIDFLSRPGSYEHNPEQVDHPNGLERRDPRDVPPGDLVDLPLAAGQGEAVRRAFGKDLL